MGLGIVLGARLLPRILRVLEDASSSQLILVTLGTLLGLAFVGQALGLLLGNRLHIALPGSSVRALDRAGGAVAGVDGVVISMWLVLPLMADVPGWVGGKGVRWGEGVG